MCEHVNRAATHRDEAIDWLDGGFQGFPFMICGHCRRLGRTTRTAYFVDNMLGLSQTVVGSGSSANI